ncbi:MAG: beta-ketoacyl synthase chain length factor [Pseudomonadales bacterium]|nr:beta-ketoacyl synthase chain length factor [Pseudomonadales bacterium]
MKFQLEAWSAIAGEVNTEGDWHRWLANPLLPEEPVAKAVLKKAPAMLRRRFGVLGKSVMGAVLPIIEDGEAVPGVFASRHGDLKLTLSLLKDIGLDQPLSPTGFGLAVHNAVAGLLSIARRDTSEVTAISASEGLVLQALFEAIGQLQVSEKVLCVIYDAPVPEPYSNYVAGDPFPYAIAVILSRTNDDAQGYRLIPRSADALSNSALPEQFATEPLRFIELLAGNTTAMESELNGVSWRIEKDTDV